MAGFLEVRESITNGGRKNACEVVSLEQKHRGILQAASHVAQSRRPVEAGGPGSYPHPVVCSAL